MERKFEQGRYIVTDARSGMALDLSGADNRSLIAFGLHGWENQQASLITPHWVQEIAKWSSLLLPTVAAIARRRTVLYATCCHDLRLQWDFRPCGKGYIINSVHSSGSFLMLQDLKGLHLEGSAQVVTGTFPTCWEVEVTMDDRNAPGPVDEPGDIFARIRLPHFDGILLCFKGTSAGAPLFAAKEGRGLCTYWRLRPSTRRSDQVAENVPITTGEAVVQGGRMTKTMITTTSVTTTTRTVTQIVPDNA